MFKFEIFGQFIRVHSWESPSVSQPGKCWWIAFVWGVMPSCSTFSFSNIFPLSSWLQCWLIRSDVDLALWPRRGDICRIRWDCRSLEPDWGRAEAGLIDDPLTSHRHNRHNWVAGAWQLDSPTDWCLLHTGEWRLTGTRYTAGSRHVTGSDSSDWQLAQS